MVQQGENRWRFTFLEIKRAMKIIRNGIEDVEES